jgi:hypothetical protein
MKKNKLYIKEQFLHKIILFSVLQCFLLNLNSQLMALLSMR